jgi:predicted RNA polymerase sigma factor
MRWRLVACWSAASGLGDIAKARAAVAEAFRSDWGRVVACALDRLRRPTVGEAKLKELAMTARASGRRNEDDSGIEDDRLRLMFNDLRCSTRVTARAQALS